MSLLTLRYVAVTVLTAALAACAQSPTQPTAISQAIPVPLGSGDSAGPTAAQPAPVPSSITLIRPQAATSALWPSLGDYVSFTVTYPSKFDRYGVRIQVICSQNGVVVYGEAGPHYQQFLLGGGSSDWLRNGGPAACKADLYYWSYSRGRQTFNLLATTNFDAY